MRSPAPTGATHRASLPTTDDGMNDVARRTRLNALCALIPGGNIAGNEYGIKPKKGLSA
jgi:hypothetical protein